MQITRAGEKQYRMVLSPAETRVFVKGMYETFKRIPPREYQTRMGPSREQVEAVAKALEANLK